MYSLVVGLVPGSFVGSGWLIFYSSYGVANPFSSFSPFSTPSFGTLCSVQWLAASIHLCICQALAELRAGRTQLYQAPVSKYFLASTIMSGFGDYIWDGSPGGAVSGCVLSFVPARRNAHRSQDPSMAILYYILTRKAKRLRNVLLKYPLK